MFYGAFMLSNICNKFMGLTRVGGGGEASVLHLVVIAAKPIWLIVHPFHRTQLLSNPQVSWYPSELDNTVLSEQLNSRPRHVELIDATGCLWHCFQVIDTTELEATAKLRVHYLRHSPHKDLTPQVLTHWLNRGFDPGSSCTRFR